MLYFHEAEITLSYPFPLDMLRYDGCYPKNSDDARKIEDSIEQHPTERYTVHVCQHSQKKLDPWTDDRWKSFGATVRHVVTCRA